MDVTLDKILTKKAQELGISKAQALSIFNSLPRFIAKVMSEGNPLDLDTYKSVYIKDLGIIFPRKDIAKNIQRSILNNQNQENEDIQPS
jgi:hypothetical protein